jgi:predicted enzyme related to lactoylglutathione lyase
MSDARTMPRTELTATDHRVGDIWWMDLSTSDIDRAIEFYAGLFGWMFTDTGAEFGNYHQVFKDGKVVAGLMAQSDDMKQMGAPSAWTPYVSVESAEQVAAQAKELGAVVLVAPMPVRELGSMAVLADPAGAVFGIWQAGEFTGADLINSPGALCWTEARTTDMASVQPFYEALFGWKAEAMDMEGMKYSQFLLDGQPAAGLMPLEGDMANVPSHWGVTVGVENLETALDYTRANGGQVTFGPMTIPYGTFAGIVDPTGAALNILELAPVNQG